MWRSAEKWAKARLAGHADRGYHRRLNLLGTVDSPIG